MFHIGKGGKAGIGRRHIRTTKMCTNKIPTHPPNQPTQTPQEGCYTTGLSRLGSTQGNKAKEEGWHKA